MLDGKPISSYEDSTPESLWQTFYYREKRHYVLSHVFRNGICESQKDVPINLCSQTILGDFTLSLDTASFSEDPLETEKIVIDTNPKGGIFKLRKADGDSFDPTIKQVYTNPEDPHSPWNYVLENNHENPLPHGDYILSYYFPVCDVEIAEHPIVVQSNPYVILQRYVFCSNDKHRYPIYLHPAEGELKVEPDAGIVRDRDFYFFEPSRIEDDAFNTNLEVVITLTYTPEDGESVNKELKVIKVPDKIIAEDTAEYDKDNLCRLTGYKYSFTAEGGKANRYEWQIGDETKAVYDENKPFEYVFPLREKPYVVKLAIETILVSDDKLKSSEKLIVCRNDIIKDISVCPGANDPLSVNVVENEPDIYEIKVNPLGGTFSLINANNKVIPADDYIERKGGVDCDESDVFYLDTSDLTDGVYRLKYAFPECDLSIESDEFIVGPVVEPPMVSKRSTSGVRSDSTTKTIRPSESLNKLLNQRGAARKTRVEELEKDAGLAQTKSFGLAKMFLLFTGEPDELNKRFNEAATLLINSISRASGKRKKNYEELLAIITHSYLDKLVIATPEKLGNAAKEVLAGIAEKIKKSKLKSGKILGDWEEARLKETIDVPAVDEIRKILK